MSNEIHDLRKQAEIDADLRIVSLCPDVCAGNNTRGSITLITLLCKNLQLYYLNPFSYTLLNTYNW